MSLSAKKETALSTCPHAHCWQQTSLARKHLKSFHCSKSEMLQTPKSLCIHSTSILVAWTDCSANNNQQWPGSWNKVTSVKGIITLWKKSSGWSLAGTDKSFEIFKWFSSLEDTKLFAQQKSRIWPIDTSCEVHKKVRKDTSSVKDQGYDPVEFMKSVQPPFVRGGGGWKCAKFAATRNIEFAV